MLTFQALVKPTTISLNLKSFLVAFLFNCSVIREKPISSADSVVEEVFKVLQSFAFSWIITIL